MFYDYLCPECGHVEEDIQHGMTETPEIKCPKCDTLMGQIISGGSGTIYKGNGWGGTRPGSDSSQARRITTTAKYDPIGEY